MELECEEDTSIIVVTPAPPFIAWVKKLLEDDGDKFDLETVLDEPNAYIIPAFEEPEELERILKKHAKTIFLNELEGWSTDSSLFPKDMGYSTFRKWFKVLEYSMIFDLT